MKVAVIGEKDFSLKDKRLRNTLPKDTKEIILCGLKNIDSYTYRYLFWHHIDIRQEIPEFIKYRTRAPLKLALDLVDLCDYIILFWDGESLAAHWIVERCQKQNKKGIIFLIPYDDAQDKDPFNISLFDK